MKLTEARAIVKKAERKEEAEQEQRTWEAAESLVGKHFKFLNSAGGDHYWWLYVRVLKVVSVWKHVATVQAESVQAQQPVGVFGIMVEVHNRTSVYAKEGLGPSYLPITEEEYVRETNKIFSRLGLTRVEPSDGEA